MSKIEILIKDKKDEIKFTKVLMFLVDVLDMKDRIKISVKEADTDEILQNIFSQIPYISLEEQAEWEKILENSNLEIDEGHSQEIEI